MNGDFKTAFQAVRWSVKAVPQLLGGINRLHECDPGSEKANLILTQRVGEDHYGQNELQRVKSEILREETLASHKPPQKNRLTYAVRLFPGVTGLCYMLDRYHSAEISIKGMSLPRCLKTWGKAAGRLKISSECLTMLRVSPDSWNYTFCAWMLNQDVHKKNVLVTDKPPHKTSIMFKQTN